MDEQEQNDLQYFDQFIEISKQDQEDDHIIIQTIQRQDENDKKQQMEMVDLKKQIEMIDLIKQMETIQILVYKEMKNWNGSPIFIKNIAIEKNFSKSFLIKNKQNKIIQQSNNLKMTSALTDEIYIGCSMDEPLELQISFQEISESQNKNEYHGSQGKIIIKDFTTNQVLYNYIKINSCFLVQSSTFSIGLPFLIIKQIYNKLGDFFNSFHRTSQEYTPQGQPDIIYDALQSLPQKILFSGIDDTLMELFMRIQERNINRNQFYEEFIENNFSNEMESVSESNCIWVNIQRDGNPIENYMLVADKKNKFILGRLENADIRLNSHSVSRVHGQIEFVEKNTCWLIQDGIQNEIQEWKPSTWGIWNQMSFGKQYQIDFDQFISIGMNYFMKFSLPHLDN